MDYEVIDENGINNVEFDFYLEPGFMFEDGEFEPDLLNNWLVYGRVAPMDDDAAPAAAETETEAVEDEPEADG